jgi:hypothetical protein
LKTSPITRFLLAAALLQTFPGASPVRAEAVSYVIHVSVDGLRADVIPALGAASLPNFYRLRTEGSFTDNARTDYDYTETLQNHCTQMTARGVLGVTGHNWTGNSDPAAGQNLHTNKGSYVAGVYDVAHDAGLRTGHYASKTKFSLFDTSWNSTYGALDAVPPDYGKDKIDVYLYGYDTAALEHTMINAMVAQPFHYVFLHLADPDRTGHDSGWYISPTNSAYCNTIREMDKRIGRIFSLIDTNAQFTGRTAIVVTADHGGDANNGHGTATVAANYTIPFYVWGPGIMPGGNLYLMNPTNRLNPGTGRPTYSAPVQPIRNGEAVNVALRLLGLPAVPGSTIGAAQDLALGVSPPSDFQLTIVGNNAVVGFTMLTNVLYDIQGRGDLTSGGWSNVQTNIKGTTGSHTNVIVGQVSANRFYRLKLHF